MKVLTLLGAVGLIVAIVILGPFVTIWSLNTLFGLGIAYSFWSWLAMVWLVGIIFGRYSTSK